jgi:hypothetical protein
MSLRLLLVAAAALVSGSPHRVGTTSSQNGFVEQKPNNGDLQQQRFLVELAPGETRWVTEEDKLDMLRVRSNHRSKI